MRCDTAGANCSDIGGAASKTYDLVVADIGSTIRVRVTASNLSCVDVDAESEATVEITGRTPVNTSPPAISGNAEEASTLTADPGTWDGTQPIDFAYQWLRCDADGDDCNDIGGATSQTYDLVPADVGSTIRVRVTATNVAGMETERAPATALIVGRVPSNDAVPTISGTPQEASTLTADPGTWTGTQPISFTYQWLRCDTAGANCSDIGGATNQTYVLVPADIGSTIRIRVTATNIVGTPVSADSAETAEISGRVPVNTAPPVVTGNPQESSTLSASPGTWTGTQPINFTYQWLRCDSAGANCADIGGATSPDLPASCPPMSGSRIRVRVTATNIVGIHAAQSSATNADRGQAAGQHSRADDLRQPAGRARRSPPTPAPGPAPQPITFTYQWRRCEDNGSNSCTDIAGATAQTYALVPADIGYMIRVRVTASNASPTHGRGAERQDDSDHRAARRSTRSCR